MATNSFGEGLFKVGNFVSCKTCFEERISGEVMAYDPVSKFLVLKMPSVNGERKNTHDIRIVNLNAAKDPQVEKVASEPPPRLPRLNIQKLNKRAEEAINAKQMHFRLLQDGITTEAQNLFHTINKTLPCKWQGAVIVVNDDVKVLPPYGTENCQGKESAVVHIKKIVEKFHKDQAASST
ncbi:protein LSM12 homolog A-like [Acanthaster planci]|uniref:Protein LSM12 homolog A-like n=1 Tax=Acanthaster planci TaxID=133434 RepID=A0A8B7XJ67_ACAPL|nr:protein LSM12 homolog A-like [Acanthaster planci]